MIGRKLAHYEIVEKLGEGGMGAVYKARDHHLDRFVAIKVLPPGKVSDPERKRRFVQEAKAASALNHPNIITIHDIASDNGTDYIAMEYVAGKTLGQVIPRQGMRLEEVLRLAIPIADALAKAHGAGITHRDLKPSNLMIDGDGRVRVLDFGLAKLTDRTETSEHDATLTQDPTAEGTIVGTVSYMSPEQAEAKKVDARSDIFSFGAVLYEMVTGQKAFHGDTPMSTLAAVINKEPKPLTEASPVTPRDLDRIITRCLRKDPERRFQLMKEVRIALDELKEESESGLLSTSTVPKPAGKRNARAWWGVAAALLVILAAGGAWWWKGQSPSAPPQLTMQALTADSGRSESPAISPDGKLVAYASDRATQKNLDIWVHPLAKGARPIRLTQHDADERGPSFSPDGGLIAFHSSRDGGGIYLVTAHGGEERLLVQGGRHPRFSPDGNWVAYTVGDTGVNSDSRVYLVPTAGGAPKQLASDVPWAWGTTFSPDGKHVLFAGSPSVNAVEAIDWWVSPVDGGASTKTGIVPALRRQARSPVPPQGTFFYDPPEWVDNRLLFSCGGHLCTVEISPRTWKTSGTAQQLTSGSSRESAPRAVKVGDVFRIAFSVASGSAHLWSLKLDTKTGEALGEPEALPFTGGSQGDASASADGRRLVYQQREPGSDSIRVRDLTSGNEATLLTAGVRPRISPDGSIVAYSDQRSLSLIPASGGEATRLLEFRGSGNLYGWSPDGAKILYWDREPVRFSLFDTKTRQTAELLSHPEYHIHEASFSPDQRWLAFHTPLGRQTKIWIAPVRDGRAAGEADWIKVIDQRADHRKPWWSPDGNALYFIGNADGFNCIYLQRLEAAGKHPAGAPLAVYHNHSTRFTLGSAFLSPTVLPGRIIFGMLERTSNVWFAERNE
ncbi:MAG: protein kinase domain-containing protein [Bryobacteraceae bacterium]